MTNFSKSIDKEFLLSLSASSKEQTQTLSKCQYYYAPYATEA